MTSPPAAGAEQRAPLALSRIVPVHIERHDFRWLKRDFTVMNADYRRIREKCGGTMMECHWCHHKFADGETIGLAQPEAFGQGNWALCQSCCDEMEASHA